MLDEKVYLSNSVTKAEKTQDVYRANSFRENLFSKKKLGCMPSFED